ncbi:ribosome maturation factor RimM [Sulfurospirillum barnesii]|uniref:Ribosome maturation factor RimM n=1 Tax=Sulfurospirillum barnesii (strain ATCC 700032 / DSM 10660 / SES-3) TaxID=760154 RepID=I3XYH8_SULBS|nr:ribosome maturation factor RimM [Sulfurospirillum barnesii]AFL69002.1 16S rRNA processing protein RimM [Sulfurospirillum barnesii SES-3]
MNNQSSLIEVAKIGRLVGLKGELKLYLECDFPEQFKKGKTFTTQKGEVLEVFSYNHARGLISFVGFQEREVAAKLVNSILYTSQENSMKECALKEGEFFWFDLIGASVIDEDLVCLGVVDEIERIGVTDYLVVKTEAALLEKGLAKLFYVPYIERYVISFDKENKRVYVKDGLGILENS